MPLFRINGKIVLFIHIPKTGGSSIEDVLSRYGPASLIMPKPPYLPTAPQHFHFEICDALFPAAFYDYAFAVVRNPFDRIFSEYRYRLHLQDTHQPFDIWWRSARELTARNPFALDSHLMPQTAFLGPGVEVFRFEDGIDNALCTVAETLQIDTPADAPHLRRHSEVPMTVDPQVLTEIRAVYRADFDQLGYADDPSAVLRRRRIDVSLQKRRVYFYWSIHRQVKKARRRLGRIARAVLGTDGPRP